MPLAKNEWAENHRRVLSKLLYDIEVYDQMGSYGGNLDLQGIMKIMREAYTEVGLEHDKYILMHAKMEETERSYNQLKIKYEDLDKKYKQLQSKPASKKTEKKTK